MTNAFRRVSTTGALLSFALLLASATAQTPSTSVDTPFEKQLGRIDLGLNGSGFFTPVTSGTNYFHLPVQQTPSNTLGYLVELRYVRSPLVGIQYNYSYARITENFLYTYPTVTGTTQTILGIQTKVSEFSLGYVAHARKSYFGVAPFAGVGAGAIAFRPTVGGGENAPPVFRSAFYYTAGFEYGMLENHVGLRAQFRQAFYGAPDFNENYLATGARSISTEPTVGIYFRF